LDFLFVVWILSIALVLLTAIGFGRMAWRIMSGREEFEPGGSYGRQAIGRYHEDRRPDRPSRRRRLRRSKPS
jgi:hypothetical protein